MTDHVARSALVLQGGGALGAYELGAARAFYEDGTFAPDVIAGVSIGAITAVLLARPKRGFKPLEALEAFWAAAEQHETCVRLSVDRSGLAQWGSGSRERCRTWRVRRCDRGRHESLV